MTFIKEIYKEGDSAWGFSIPPSNNRSYERNAVGSLVNEINPNYLSFWLPEIGDRGTFVAAGVFLFVLTLFSFPSLIFHDKQIDHLTVLDYFVLALIPIFLFLLSFLFIALPFRRPLPPPVFFCRKSKKVWAWEKSAGWYSLDWNTLIPVMKRFTLYNQVGRQTLYVLTLLDVDPATKIIRRHIKLYTPELQFQPLQDIWEFIRRYMNEPPENVPVSYLAPNANLSPKHWAIRMQIEALAPYMNPDTGEWQCGLHHRIAWGGFAPIQYPLLAASIYVQKKAPCHALPPHLAAQMHWPVNEPNPYKIIGDGVEGAPGKDIDAMYERIKWRHRITMCVGLGFHAAFLGLMVASIWLE